ncbi:hypothetical protein PACTADRAFT_47835 [Pachysolen tannophilus NRRL Y-2460]|uniref:1-phosphatidylinositol 4-kinase n=1 Tax=Pachysolen tannophilus NRRL Y-2460 TaxID=669874 RepID=A0A1E4U1X6_PACTA|nr:hypothetical protein PACTADRAFT_47835 [Pachysolen tannophilus NRRL Y-2460]
MEEASGHSLLLRFINSPHFNIYYCISYLIRYADNIGIQHCICTKLANDYSIEELKFFIPQFLQTLLTVETDSLALEELIKDLCSRDVHFNLMTFWYLRASLQELSKDCGSISFQICKRLLNDLQFQLFNTPRNVNTSSTSTGIVRVAPAKAYNENVYPSIILASSIAASIGLPQVGTHVAPIVKTQGKMTKSFVFQVVKGLQKELNKNLTLKNTRQNAALANSNVRSSSEEFDDDDDFDDSNPISSNFQKLFQKQRKQKNEIGDNSREWDFSMIDKYAEENLPHLKRSLSGNNLIKVRTKKNNTISNGSGSRSLDFKYKTDSPKELISSMPNLSLEDTYSSSSVNLENNNITPAASYSGRTSRDSRYSSDVESIYENPQEIPSTPRRRVSSQAPATLTTPQKIKLLKSNYFKCETQFAIALQNISYKLSQVPKEARLSSLRAELSILNKDLPCEVDIPMLLPRNKKGKLHKVVRIPPNESAVLNSAERVPFLLLIEFLSDEMDFDPATPENEQLLKEILSANELSTEDGHSVSNSPKDQHPHFRDRKYVFDLAGTLHNSSSYTQKILADNNLNGNGSGGSADTNDPSETDLADFSVIKLSNKTENEFLAKKNFLQNISQVPILDNENETEENGKMDNALDSKPKIKNGNNESFTENDNEFSRGRSSELNFQSNYKLSDISNSNNDLATQMRIAAVMLTQLDSSSNQLPQDETAAVKARIISSMQALQDNFDCVKDLEEIHGAAGERKLENDLKLSGVRSSFNNPMDYYLGEDWNAKKERIRKESIYGHLENWDLCSVIAKTGHDLTQEAFACQLIQSMAKIWYKNNVGIWVKKMRILVTSSNTGLVETITNALSIHSIKKTLTQYQIATNENLKGNIATLKDHFLKTFGDCDSPRYKRAQDNFACSLAGYSIICYILQIKDRHNGNIMLDNEGHIIHIDFGFLLSNSPGSVGFEAAPFKLTLEYVEILGGPESFFFKKFVNLVKDSFKAIRKNSESIVSLVELMQKDSSLPCFRNGENTSVQMRQRLQLNLTDEECDAFVENYLIGKSLGSIYTRLYDQFQLFTQGIYS